ncbi:MAG: hypothetical protein K9H16_01575 [Bacteroidales bacterium]|nr:hypothetical protein [Bacteroidales bacterium]
MMIKKKINKNILYLSLMAITFLIASCEKEETTDFVNQAKITSLHLGLDVETIRLAAMFHKALFDTVLYNHDTAIIDSALVTISFDSLNNQKVFNFDFGDGQIGPDQNTRSGKITATLSGNFVEESSVFTAHFNDYNFDGFVMDGELLFSNVGKLDEGNTFYTLAANFESFDETGNKFVQTSNKYMVWTEGEPTPQNWQEHEFTISGDAWASFRNNGNVPIQESQIITTIVNDWILRLSCGKAIHSGSLSTDFEIGKNTEIITGDFIDSDIDGCSDKVILKNSDNFGYPFYF